MWQGEKLIKMAKELRKRMAAKTDKLEVFNKEKKNNQTDEEYNN